MTPLDWHINDNYRSDHVGARTLLINADDPSSAADQLLTLGYPIIPPGTNITMTADDCLMRGGANPLPPAAFAMHHLERVFIYPFGWVAVVGLDGSFKLFYVE